MFLPDSVIVVLFLAIIAAVIFRDEIFDAYDNYLYNEAVTLADRRMYLFTEAGYYDDKTEEQFLADWQEAIQYFYHK